MLALEQMLDSLARTLAVDKPPPDPSGAFVFGLADGMTLNVRPSPDGVGCLIWSAVASADPNGPPSRREARALAALQIRLARLRRHPALVAAMDEDGSIFLHCKARPATENEWLDAVSSLLNEAEAFGNLMDESAGGGRQAAPSPFAGMGNWLDRP